MKKLLTLFALLAVVGNAFAGCGCGTSCGKARAPKTPVPCCHKLVKRRVAAKQICSYVCPTEDNGSTVHQGK